MPKQLGAIDMTTHRGFEDICSTFISQIDFARERWVALIKEVIADELLANDMRIVNEDFNENIDIGMQEHDAPKPFPFRSVNGETVEAAIIGWQVQVALDFALRKGYIQSDQLPEFSMALGRKIGQDDLLRWALSVGVSLSGELMVSDCISAVLAHYLMNDPTRSASASTAYRVLETKGMPLLGAFTYLSTAVAFGDEESAREIMAKLQPGQS
jgi:hypothetical protein